MEAETIIAKAREYLDVPVVHAGRNKLGVDCVGLLLCVGRDLGLFDYENVDYSPHVVPERLVGELEKFAYKKSEHDPIELADIIVFDFKRFPCHLGIVSQNGTDKYFIHTNVMLGKVVEQRIDPEWMDRIFGLYKLKV